MVCSCRALYTDVAAARMELGKHVDEIRMAPQGRNGEAHYVAEGQWNLLGGYGEGERRTWLVAGARYGPSAMMIPFRLDLRKIA